MRILKNTFHQPGPGGRHKCVASTNGRLRPRFPVASSKAGCDRRVPKRPRPGKISAQCRAAQCRAAQCRAAQCRVRPSAVRPNF